MLATLPKAPNNAEVISVSELKTLADAMGCVTQGQLAERLGVSQPRVSQILSGAHPVKKGPLMKLIRTLQANYFDKKVEQQTTVKKRRPRSSAAVRTSR